MRQSGSTHQTERFRNRSVKIDPGPQPPPATAVGSILGLQRQIGNRATAAWAAKATGSSTRTDAATVAQRTCGDRNAHAAPAAPANCHEYVLLRLLDDLGFGGAQGMTMLQIIRSKYALPGSSLGATRWYGPELMNKVGAFQVDRNSIRALPVGTILLTPDPRAPMHTMLLDSQVGGHTYIRGFNNFGTLGTGVANQDDPTPRDLHGATPQAWQHAGVPSYWKANNEFWQGMYAANRANVLAQLSQHASMETFL